MSALNEIIHQPARLRIMAALNALDPKQQVEFSYLGKLLKLTDGNFGAHLQTLEKAGYIKIEKAFVDRKPRTYISASSKGRHEFHDHTLALEEILKGKIPG